MPLGCSTISGTSAARSLLPDVDITGLRLNDVVSGVVISIPPTRQHILVRALPSQVMGYIIVPPELVNQFQVGDVIEGMICARLGANAAIFTIDFPYLTIE